MLVLHDDAKREDAYGLPKGFPTRVGIFTQDSRRGWIVISMKDDWKRLRHYGRAKGPTYRSVKMARSARPEWVKSGRGGDQCARPLSANTGLVLCNRTMHGFVWSQQPLLFGTLAN
jgi:hypothetical protein